MKNADFKDLLINGQLASMVKEATKGETLSSSKNIFNIIKPLMNQHRDVEKMYCIFLDTQNQIISIDVVAEGSIWNCHLYPREIIKKILYHQARSIILAHNHPSGSMEASPEDLSFTRKIMIACITMDISFHDHAIIGKTLYSMADNGIISGIKEEIEFFMNN